ncbi:MAG: helicase-related protein [Verrucomicrobia bacterium]|nr:helicase-related protein [Verrucomicrobiota bacterium]
MAAGVMARDNPHAPHDPERRLSDEERRRIRAWEEAPLLDEISVTPFFRGTLINLGFLAVRYEGLRDRTRVAQLNANTVRLWIPGAEQRLKCGVCSWPLSGATVDAPCPRCHGSAVPWTDGEVHGHRTIRRLLQGVDQPLVAEEHTAQITTERRVVLEDRFKAPAGESPLNVLACSPTMEMGIDVGGLDAVVLRNVPPRPDNYAQRGGRAGRRTRVGLVVGYARSTPHDQYFYDHPEEMISGEIPTPAISLGNRDVILRHLCAIAFGAAEPGLAGRMVEYVDAEGRIATERVNELIEGVRSQSGYALELAHDAWGTEILTACGLTAEALHRHLEQVPARIQRVMDATARQVLDLRQPLEAFAANVIGRQQGNRAADLVARLLVIQTGRRDGGGEASDSSAGYPLRRFAEFGVLPGSQFLIPAENELALVGVSDEFVNHPRMGGSSADAVSCLALT